MNKLCETTLTRDDDSMQNGSNKTTVTSTNTENTTKYKELFETRFITIDNNISLLIHGAESIIPYIIVNAPYFDDLRRRLRERMVFLGGHLAKY